MWKKTVEIHIGPVENFTGAVDVVTKEETKRRFLHLEDLAGSVEGAKRWNTFKMGLALILAADAATELSKATFPLLSSELTPLSNYPLLSQLSEYSETPLGVGLLATIGLIYLGKSVFRDRAILQAISRGMRRVQISPVDLHEPLDDRDNDDQGRGSFS